MFLLEKAKWFDYRDDLDMRKHRRHHQIICSSVPRSCCRNMAYVPLITVCSSSSVEVSSQMAMCRRVPMHGRSLSLYSIFQLRRREV
jgi:hypothetical protein